MNNFKDYNLVYQHISTVNRTVKLRVVLATSEFGPMESRTLDKVADEGINTRLLDSLADEVIDEYERRLASRPVQVAVA